MKAQKKYIFPLALVKVVLFFLVMQLFFSSCESDDLYYEGELYSEGALVEIAASFGVEEQVYSMGDTLFLEIALENTQLENRLTGNMVNLADAEFKTSFAFANEAGVVCVPSRFIATGANVSFNREDSAYTAYFGYMPSSKSAFLFSANRDMPYLRVEFVFDEPGDYTVYFINTPNNFIGSGDVDIAYQHDADSGEAQAFAYAVYSFDIMHRSQVYGLASKPKEEILNVASIDQAIIDFKVLTASK